MVYCMLKYILKTEYRNLLKFHCTIFTTVEIFTNEYHGTRLVKGCMKVLNAVSRESRAYSAVQSVMFALRF